MIHLSEPPYRIQLFGQLEVRRNGVLLSIAKRRAAKSQKALARLILARGQVVADCELIRILGIDTDKNAVATLKVLIHRIRKLMPGEIAESESCIIRTSGGYAWNMDFCAQVDVFEAESVCDRVITASKLSNIGQDDIFALVESFASDLLPEMTSEPWVELAQFRLEMQYTAAISRALTLMWNENAVDQIIFTCLFGLSTNPMEPIFRDNLRRARSVADHQVEPQIPDMPLLDTRQKDAGLRDAFIEDIVLRLGYAAQAERESIRQRQREGIAGALQRGVRFGRPLKAPPPEFPQLREACANGELSQTACAKALGVSRQTFLRWCQEADLDA